MDAGHYQYKQHAVGDRRSRCRPQANWTKHSIVFDSGPFSLLGENMMSSTKPEVHNVLYCRQMKTCHGYREYAQKTKSSETWTLVFEICEQTDKQTDR